ncbi:hypothetical protein J7T55_002570 [Diaporthe amygdali]|uniref:uncharacterized protein n=1 Tax=Phomopsis amygdali TaxID=1214568 RepID=UPI0022FEC51F|nr:uncharacterized protein J7T55_002570 [Diaporthe amygdali]KAJ0122059.1 hypothetical protein J7T55_002570 [Diaporthe amygdali]
MVDVHLTCVSNEGLGKSVRIFSSVKSRKCGDEGSETGGRKFPKARMDPVYPVSAVMASDWRTQALSSMESSREVGVELIVVHRLP